MDRSARLGFGWQPAHFGDDVPLIPIALPGLSAVAVRARVSAAGRQEPEAQQSGPEFPPFLQGPLT